MKPNPLACALLVLLAIAVQLPAQNTNTASVPSWADTQPVTSSGTNAAGAAAPKKQTAEEFLDAPDAAGTNKTVVQELKESKVFALAEKGDAKDQYAFGMEYLFVATSPKEYAEAVEWIRKAAEQDDVAAQSQLADFFIYHKSVLDPAGQDVFVFAAVASLYKETDEFVVVGKEGSYDEGVKWARKAADKGDRRSQYLLGLAFSNGHGVAKDYATALQWYRKAAEQGDAEALNAIGEMYDNGQGVPKNGKEAEKWFRKGAVQGDKFSQLNLGELYKAGDGVPQNYIEAYKWFNIAAAQGAGGGMRDKLAEKMSPEQIAEGQRLSAAFVPGKDTPGSNSDNSTSPENPTATGTGFFITDDGYLITNNHVVKDATKVRLVTSAGMIDAKVVKVDAANDLALLKAEGKFAPLPIAASRTAHLGGTVATIGFPDPTLQGFAPKLAKGEIASLSGAGDDPRYFQISVPVQPGNSGGALVDERGNVVGIVSAKLDASAALAASGALPENVNYAVKSSFLLGFLESVPDVSAKLKEPNTEDEKFEDVVKSAQQAAVLVLVY